MQGKARERGGGTCLHRVDVGHPAGDVMGEGQGSCQGGRGARALLPIQLSSLEPIPKGTAAAVLLDNLGLPHQCH